MKSPNRKLYKYQPIYDFMEMIRIPKEKLEMMELELEKFRKIDFELISKFQRSLEDVKAGRIRRVA